MIIDLSFLNSDLVISGVLAFLTGMAGMMAYTKIRNAGTKRAYQADEAVVEAVVLEYTRRLRDYDKVIAELRARLDIMEVRSQPYVASPSSRQPQPHVAPVSEPVVVTQHATVEERQENNGTTDYILKLLAERPRTSREVQHAVGRTREHTARLMKKLHDSGLVSRDVNSKPFKYTITDSGQERLKEKTEVASEPPSVV
jgi:hypothetical protein